MFRSVVAKWWQQLGDFLNQTYALGHNRGLAQREDEVNDFFMIVTFSECLGLPNPYAFYTLDLLPDLLPKFHRWHLRMGLESSFWERLPCGCC